MLITRDLNTEFRRTTRQSEALGVLRTAAREAGPYSYLSPDLVRSPSIVQGPSPVRVGHSVANIGQNSRDSSYLSGVEKRAIMKSAGTIMYTEPEMMGPLFDPINWFLPYGYPLHVAAIKGNFGM